MNNNRFLIMLVIALILAGGAAWIAKNWVVSQTAQKSEQTLVPVVVAALDISYGAKLDANQLKLLGWPKDHLPKGAFTDIKPLIGKIAQRAFVADEALLEPQVKDKSVGSILSAMIPEGKRAISVPVSAISGVAGFITPGNLIDILTTKNGRTYILLSHVKVMAIDQLVSPEQDKPAVVTALTLEVTVQEAITLVKAMQSGSFYFTLRNPTDKQNTAAIPEQENKASNDSNAKESTSQSFAIQPVKPRVTVIEWPSGPGKRQEIDEGANLEPRQQAKETVKPGQRQEEAKEKEGAK